MKIRCEGNSIRLRLKKSEIAMLMSENRISESINFPNGQSLSYAISMSSDIESINPLFYENNIEIQLPMDIAEAWINTNMVGIDCSIELDNDQQLDLLIEKDFPCLDRPNEDKSDTFFELVPDKPNEC